MARYLSYLGHELAGWLACHACPDMMYVGMYRVDEL